MRWIDTVHIQGDGLRSSAGGTILIDPQDIIWEGSGDDVFTDGADYALVATNSISLVDVVISSRQVAGSGRNAHLTEMSTGDSGNITLQAPDIELTNSRILSFATGTYNAGNVTLSANYSVILTNTQIDASAVTGTAGNTAGDVVIEAINKSSTVLDDFLPVAVKDSRIKIDSQSVIRGNDIVIEALTTAGVRNEFLEDAFDFVEHSVHDYISDLDGDLTDVLDEFLGLDVTFGVMQGFDDVADQFAGSSGADFLLGDAIPFDVYDVDSSVQIDGILQADGDINISSSAVVESTVRTLAISGFYASVSVTSADSTISIGGKAVLEAGRDITIESIVESGVEHEKFHDLFGDEDPFAVWPLDLSVGVGVMTGNNRIDIGEDVRLTAENGRIDILANTERSASISVSGGRSSSAAALWHW